MYGQAKFLSFFPCPDAIVHIIVSGYYVASPKVSRPGEKDVNGTTTCSKLPTGKDVSAAKGKSWNRTPVVGIWWTEQCSWFSPPSMTRDHFTFFFFFYYCFYLLAQQLLFIPINLYIVIDSPRQLMYSQSSLRKFLNNYYLKASP